MSVVPQTNVPARAAGASASIHAKSLIAAVPPWLIDATPQRREALSKADTTLAQAYWRATPQRRQRVHDCVLESFTAQTVLDKTMSALQDIETFGRPLLVKALKDQYGVELAGGLSTWISLRKSLQVSYLNIEARTYDYLKLELFQAALHNFEASECEEGFFHSSSGFRWQTGSLSEPLLPVRLGGLKVHQFLTLCRQLNIGGQYQAYLKRFFHPAEASVEATLRLQFALSQKAAMRAAAELALLQQDIDDDVYAMLLRVIEGERSPRIGAQTVLVRDVGLMNLRITGCVMFQAMAGEKVDYPILYIPHDPYHPLKRYRDYGHMLATLSDRFITPGAPTQRVTGPTAYQRFFSQFVSHADWPRYFSEFTQDAADATFREKIGSTFPGIGDMYELVSRMTPFRLKNFPPLPRSPQVPNPTPYLAPAALVFKDSPAGADAIDLWTYLYNQNRDKVVSDAASYAVPTADVDARVRQRKLAMFLNVGVFVLGFVAGFVPVLGAIMLGVMVAQLLYETFEAVSEWSEGDRKAAKVHLIDLAENLALIGVTAGVGKALSRPRVEPVIEGTVRVSLPDGKARLWKPDLVPYRSDVVFDSAVRPDATGQYMRGGKTYIRIDGSFYETSFDADLRKWRIRHPHDDMAYQPILEHNGEGAWRHIHEYPLSWERLKLLRRLGHCAEGFSDETLSAVGEISGVSDDQLRKVHMDGLPVPAVLADTLEDFKVDQQVDELIGQIRRGTPRDAGYEYALGLVVEMPGWPQAKVLEVFAGSEPVGHPRVDVGKTPIEQLVGSTGPLGEDAANCALGQLGSRFEPVTPLIDEWSGAPLKEPLQVQETRIFSGRSVRHGRPLSPGANQATLKISIDDVFQGKLASTVLAGLSEDEAAQLLGSESTWGGATRTQVFNERLADVALQRQQALFSALLRARNPHHAATGSLHRRFPTLSRRAHAQLLDLDTGNAAERLDLAARIAVQQGRLGRALSGLHRDRLAGVDSDWLALHTLARLPGWPEGLRLEIREGHINGPLKAGIGEESAAMRRYLIKIDERFQAVDAAGNALNELPPHGRNFYASIMHALPDETRQALALPSTSQGADLQQALAAYARSHRDVVANQVFKLRIPRSKPSWRLPSGRLGYELSGRSKAFFLSEQLIRQLRSVYPNIPEEEAEAFLWSRRRDGESDAQVSQMLSSRQRELAALQLRLAQWAGQDGYRSRVADDVIGCWRQGLDRDRAPSAVLNIRGAQPLPTLEADFSHVRTASLSGARLLAEGSEALHRLLPRLQRLELYVNPMDLDAVAARLPSLPGITELSIQGPSLTYSSEALQAINRMAGLEQLVLGGALQTLDVSELTSLRRLTVSGALGAWPRGVTALEHLESLDLSGTRLHSVPPEMFSGHERVWRGLQMNWAGFESQDFKAVFDHLQGNPAHLMDEARLVRDYCEGVLRGLWNGDPVFVSSAMAEFSEQGLSPLMRVARVNTVREEYQRLAAELEQWRQQDASRDMAAEKLLECWRAGLAQRFITPGQPGHFEGDAPAGSRLDLSGDRLGALPPLPTAGFAHVRDLNLSGAGVPIEAINPWLDHFTGLQAVSLAGNNLTELPSTLTRFETLRQLDLSRNRLVITAPTQARLNTFAQLSSLQLQYNPIGSLDARRLEQLRSLDLSHSAINAWPQGWQHLERLDLSHSAVTAIPEAALEGHDPLLLGTSLRGCRLTTQARAQARLFARRYTQDHPMDTLENPLGIPHDLLFQGLTGGDPEYFPDDLHQRPEWLTALPGISDPARVRPTPTERLQRLNPSLDDAQAQAWMDESGVSGHDAFKVEAKLVEWERQYDEWVSLLNQWIGAEDYQSESGISALDRRRAADRLLQGWRFTLRAEPSAFVPESAQQLNLSGLTLGDLPAVPAYFAHVNELDLSGVALTAEGSSGFLRSFAHVKNLTLSHNALPVLPNVLNEFHSLSRLDFSGNRLRNSIVLQPLLGNMPELAWLDLSGNILRRVDATGLNRLESLNLQHNLLEDWPSAVLELPRLRQMDLGNNWIETIPAAALEPRHQQLMAGTTLSGNELGLHELEDLRTYLLQTGNGLGYSAQELEGLINPSRSTSEAEFSGAEHVFQNHPDIEPVHVQKNRWFATLEADSPRHAAWDVLVAEEGSADFFFVLSRLADTVDFLQFPAELRRRVWAVLDAMGDSLQLRRYIFARATALIPGATCGDGRILIFNELETSVLEFDALRESELAQDGAALLALARSMIRLEAVEDIARAAIERSPHIDPAEVRLAYRIGLAERLQLPRQPSGMLYADLAQVSQADIDDAYVDVLAREREPGFDEKLITREYWLNYLKNKYADEFSALAHALDKQIDALEERFPEVGPAYLKEYAELGARRSEQQTALAIRLTRQERERLQR